MAGRACYGFDFNVNLAVEQQVKGYLVSDVLKTERLGIRKRDIIRRDTFFGFAGTSEKP
jgi:hypothetical protein